MRSKIKTDTLVKRKPGRPPGSKNVIKSKPIIAKEPPGTLLEFKVIQLWEDVVVISINNVNYRIKQGDFISASLKWGYNIKGTIWPLRLSEGGLAFVDWRYYDS